MAAVNPRKLSSQASLLGNVNVSDCSRPDEILWKPSDSLKYGPGPVSQFRSRRTKEFVVMNVPAVGFFYAQCLEGNSLEEVDNMFKEITEYAESDRVKNMVPLAIDDLKVGSHYATKALDDGMWYRVEVIEKFSSGNVKIFFLDDGNYDFASPSQLIPMPVDIENRRIHLKIIIMREEEPLFEEECLDEASKELLDWFRTRLRDHVVKVSNVEDDTRSLVFLDRCNINEELKRKKFELSLKYQSLIGTTKKPVLPSAPSALSIDEGPDPMEVKQMPEKLATISIAPLTMATTDAAVVGKMKDSNVQFNGLVQDSPPEKQSPSTSPQFNKKISALKPSSTTASIDRGIDTIVEENSNSLSDDDSELSEEDESIMGELMDSIIKAQKKLKLEQEKEKKRKVFEEALRQVDEFFANASISQYLSDTSALFDLVKEQEEMEKNHKKHVSSMDRLDTMNEFNTVLDKHKAAVKKMSEKIKNEFPETDKAQAEMEEVVRVWREVCINPGRNGNAENYEDFIFKYNSWSEDHTMDVMDALVNRKKCLSDLNLAIGAVFETLLKDNDEWVSSKEVEEAFSRYITAVSEEKKVLNESEPPFISILCSTVEAKIQASLSEWETRKDEITEILARDLQ